MKLEEYINKEKNMEEEIFSSEMVSMIEKAISKEEYEKGLLYISIWKKKLEGWESFIAKMGPLNFNENTHRKINGIRSTIYKYANITIEASRKKRKTREDAYTLFKNAISLKYILSEEYLDIDSTRYEKDLDVLKNIYKKSKVIEDKRFFKNTIKYGSKKIREAIDSSILEDMSNLKALEEDEEVKKCKDILFGCLRYIDRVEGKWEEKRKR